MALMADNLKGMWYIYFPKRINYYSNDTESCRSYSTRILAYLHQIARPPTKVSCIAFGGKLLIYFKEI